MACPLPTIVWPTVFAAVSIMYPFGAVFGSLYHTITWAWSSNHRFFHRRSTFRESTACFSTYPDLSASCDPPLRR